MTPAGDGPGADRPSRRGPIALLVAGYGLLLGAWVFGNPPFASPDEWAHYLRAVSIGRGQLVGAPADYHDPNLGPAEQAWVAQAAREVRVPERLLPADPACDPFDPSVPAGCEPAPTTNPRPVGVTIPNGTYQPVPYLLPAVASRFATSPAAANRLGRLAGASATLALVAAGMLALDRGRGGHLLLAGPIVALTPMVAFLGATLSPNGLEVGAGFGFAAGLLRLTAGRSPPGWVWGLVGVAGSVLALCRSTTPAWVVVIAGLVALAAGRSRVLALVRENRTRALASGGAVAVAMVANRVWEAVHGPDAAIGVPAPVGSTLWWAASHLPQWAREQVGMFGYLDFGVPRAGYVTWMLLLCILVALALLAGTRSERVGVLGALGAAAAMPTLLLAAVLVHTGFGAQGRHVIAVSVTVPLLAGEVLVRRHDRLAALNVGRLAGWFALPAGAVHLLSWYANARRHAVGLGGPLLFGTAAQWRPPGGWLPWAAVAAAGAGAIVAAGFSAPRPLPRRSAQRSS